MASVPLDFLPPIDPGATALHIYEAANPEGPFSEIETVTAVGTYPNYITRYTTDSAAVATDWFAIAWEYEAGVLGDMSEPIQGGTETLIGEVVSRVLLRDSTINENVAAQEAEAAIESVFPGVDVKTLTRTDATARELSGLTMLTMARVAIVGLLATNSAAGLDFTAGIVSVKQSSGSSRPDLKTIQALLKQAEGFLGQTYSFFLLLKEIEPTGPMELVGADLSRLIVEYE